MGFMAPRVSVLMAVYNGMPWLRGAVESIRGQTFGPWELVVVDDGSTDGTREALAVYGTGGQVRVTVVPHMGLTRALNHGLALCRALLIARLDADDVAAPDRLSRQVAFLDACPEVGLLGTGATEIDAGRHRFRVVRPPGGDAALRRALIRHNPFVHSSVMFRRSVLARTGGYDERFTVAQDYDLWLRMARVTQLGCLSDSLVTRRVHGQSVSERPGYAIRRRWAEVSARAGALAAGQYPVSAIRHVARPLAGIALGSLARVVADRLRGRRRGAVISEAPLNELTKHSITRAGETHEIENPGLPGDTIWVRPERT